jgi:hypothetical protein
VKAFAYKVVQGLDMKFVHKYLIVDVPSMMNSNRNNKKIEDVLSFVIN